jgi:subtilisin family serine protease
MARQCHSKGKLPFQRHKAFQLQFSLNFERFLLSNSLTKNNYPDPKISMKKLFVFFAVAFSISLSAQKSTAPVKAPENWFNLSYANDHTHGVGTERTYADLTKGKKADTVIVCVLDAGVDYNHEDLKDVMWHNPKEIPGNGIDDDHNGYVDDIYGWNFLGNKSGENVAYDNLEMVRLLRPLNKRFKGLDANTVSPTEKADWDTYVALKAAYDKEYSESKTYLDNYKAYQGALKKLEKDIKKQQKVDTVLYKDFSAYTPGADFVKLYEIFKKIMPNEEEFTTFHKDLADGIKELSERIDYNLNLDYDPRSIIGDNYDDVNDRNYGNPDVKGPDAIHGTHVAGIIAANRFNNVGILGVATPVKIMAVRVVPNGDERDKDVANGIRYAVDNGAKIINMSFGKAYAYNKGAVDEAVKYAESKGVLLVHAAGNDNQDNDTHTDYPNDHYLSGGVATNWIEVGALNWKNGADLVASFSNYGQTQVDVFAPGVDIYSCKVDGGYLDESGTSMASPVCAGCCALLKVYYPNLTPAQIKDIIMQSSDKSMANSKINRPGGKKRWLRKKKGMKDKKVKFKTLSISGGMVDVYAAFKLAETIK